MSQLQDLANWIKIRVAFDLCLFPVLYGNMTSAKNQKYIIIIIIIITYCIAV